MHGAGIKDLDDLQVTGDWYPSSGARGLQELLRRTPDLEAVFACNDPMAAGVLQAARRLGRRVAVVGYDDVPEAAYYEPALTTIRQPLADLGGQAVDQLIRLVINPETNCEPVWLHPQLIVRDSSVRS